MIIRKAFYFFFKRCSLNSFQVWFKSKHFTYIILTFFAYIRNKNLNEFENLKKVNSIILLIRIKENWFKMDLVSRSFTLKCILKSKFNLYLFLHYMLYVVMYWMLFLQFILTFSINIFPNIDMFGFFYFYWLPIFFNCILINVLTIRI